MKSVKCQMLNAPPSSRLDKHQPDGLNCPVCQTASDNLSSRSTESFFGNRVGDSQRAHPHSARCLDSLRGIFDHQTFAQQQRKLSLTASEIIQLIETQLESFRIRFVIRNLLRAHHQI